MTNPFARHLSSSAVSAWFRDLRYVTRGLVASPGFALGVIGSLALGIAANTTAFSVVQTAFFRPFPGVDRQEDLVRMRLSLTYDEYEALNRGMHTVSGLSAMYPTDFAVAIEERASSVPGALVSANYFTTLGATAAAGRLFGAQDNLPADPVVVLSHQFWLERWQGDRGVIGRTIGVNGTPMRIVGITARDFVGVRKGEFDSALWVPFAQSALVFRDGDGRPVHARAGGKLSLDPVGRLASGMTIGQARTEAAALAPSIVARLATEDVETLVGRVFLNDPVRKAPGIVVFSSVPAIVLAIACINAANLLLVRTSRKRRDWVLRLALGASRWQLVREGLVEALVLAFTGASAGLLATVWLLRIVQTYIPLPVTVNGSVFVFAFIAALGTAVLFGLGPTLHAAARAMTHSSDLLARARPVSRRRRALIALQAGLSLALLATGAQYMRVIQADTANDGVADPDRLAVASADLAKLGYTAGTAQDFYARLLATATSAPRVAAAGLGRSFWGGGNGAMAWLPEDDSTSPRNYFASYISGDLFAALDLPVVQGRGFVRDDATGPLRTAIVNEAFAKEVLQGDAVGRTMRVAAPGSPPGFDGGDRDNREAARAAWAASRFASGTDVLIVGVVASGTGRRTDRSPAMFLPVPLEPLRDLQLYVKFQGPAADGLVGLGAAIRAIDRRLPIALATTRALRRPSDDEDDIVASAMTWLGLMALVLAAGGLGGVVSYAVALRTREIGVRMALGATSRSVLALIIRQALWPVVIGSALGAVVAVLIGFGIRSSVMGASGVDIVAMGGTMLLMLATMTLASVIPARRVTRVDPTVVLRSE